MSCEFDECIDRCGSDSIKWAHYGEGVLPLWVADTDFRAPEPVIRALRDRVEHGIFGYGTEPPELRAVVVDWLKESYGWEVQPEALVFVPGVVTGFNLAARAVCSAGDGILSHTPVYYPILYAPGNAGCVLDQMELTRLPDGCYEVDLDRFEAAITECTRLFILCNPQNPTGRAFGRDELERMAEICLRHGVVICSDEIHCDLVFRGVRHVPIASLSPEVAARTIALLAPSKTFNIAGLKASLAVIENAELRDKFCAARAVLVPGINVLGYAAMMAAYRDGRPWLAEMLLYLEDNRDFLLDYVRGCLPGIHVGRPEATYLAWLDCRNAGIPGNPHEFFLKQARVALNDGAVFGRGGEGFVRLNFGCPRATLEEALDRMRRALEGCRA